MLVLKKKEIVATALVAMIGVAGYLNWSYQDVLQVSDGGEYVETGKKLGEAQLVSSDTQARMFSNTAIIVDIAAKNIKRKKSEKEKPGLLLFSCALAAFML